MSRVKITAKQRRISNELDLALGRHAVVITVSGGVADIGWSWPDRTEVSIVDFDDLLADLAACEYSGIKDIRLDENAQKYIAVTDPELWKLIVPWLKGD